MFEASEGRRVPPLAERLRLPLQRAVHQGTRSFMMVLALLVAIFVISEVSGETDVSLALAWTFAYVAFLVTLRALGTQPRTVAVNLMVMAALLALALTGLVSERDLLVAPAWIAVSIYAFAAPVLIMYRVLRQKQITIDLIFGALCVYLFIGIDFAIMYTVIFELDAASITFAHAGVDSLY